MNDLVKMLRMVGFTANERKEKVWTVGKDAQNGENMQFVVVPSFIREPVFRFWSLVKEKKLAPVCWFIFEGPAVGAEWRDLEKIYGGTNFGTLFFVAYRASRSPGFCPSQKGLFFNNK